MSDRQWNIICRFMYVVLYTMIARGLCNGDGAVGILFNDIKEEGKVTAK